MTREERARGYKLLDTYHRIPTQEEKGWWLKSLSLEDRALVRQHLKGNSNRLF